MWFRWFPNAFSTKFDADRPRFRPADFRSFRWLFRCFSTNGDSCFPHWDPCDFVDFPLVLQRNPSQAAQFPEFSIFVDITNAFQRNEMPAEHPPDFAFSICFPIEIDRNRCAADQPPGFSISMILLMLFHRNFVSTDFKQAPMGISFLEGTIRPLGCADFVDFLTVFQRNESKSAARICRLPIWPFRWYS